MRRNSGQNGSRGRTIKNSFFASISPKRAITRAAADLGADQLINVEIQSIYLRIKLEAWKRISFFSPDEPAHDLHKENDHDEAVACQNKTETDAQ